jgi:antitoxin (DNA-binding transcriptional repressor) of toxin-antitoxin stability system
MKKANVSELKAKLSAYLAEVRNGDTVIVCDRKTPIAQMIPFDAGTSDIQIQEASRPVSELFKGQAVRLRKRVNVEIALREARGER